MPSSHSLSGLMKWLRRDPWREAFEDVLERHLGPACDLADVEIDDLADLIGADMVAVSWGCAFEDFLTQDVGNSATSSMTISNAAAGTKRRWIRLICQGSVLR